MILKNGVLNMESNNIISILNPVNAQDAETKSVADLINPYKSYQAIISQSSTSAPTATVYKTDFGSTTFTWGRTSAGLYTVTANSAVLTASKTVILMSMPLIGLVNYIVVPTSTTVVTITTILNSVIATVLTATATDALLTNILFEIRVYP